MNKEIPDGVGAGNKALITLFNSGLEKPQSRLTSAHSVRTATLGRASALSYPA